MNIAFASVLSSRRISISCDVLAEMISRSLALCIIHVESNFDLRRREGERKDLLRLLIFLLLLLSSRRAKRPIVSGLQ